MRKLAIDSARRLEVFSLQSLYKLFPRYNLRAYLVLEDGTVIVGCGFGAEGLRIGEVVFSTSMVGYPEQITDPSYAGQLLLITYPLIGNYGVSFKLSPNLLPLHFESNGIQIEGLIISEETTPNHWSSVMSLHEWLASEDVPGIFKVDTRFLVKHIRERGTMMGLLYVCDLDEDVDVYDLYKRLSNSPSYDESMFLSKVSPNKPIVHEPRGEVEDSVLLIDCGVKYGILRELLSRNLRVIRVPYHYSFDKAVSEFSFNGVVISNGPGNPSLLIDVQETVCEALEYNFPTLGICLGCQILAIAIGGKTFKLKYGHRGVNKPVVNLETSTCFVTTQNHGYAVDSESLDDSGFKIWFINADDKTVEGLYHSKYPAISTQFHPEASPGPLDSTWIFDLYYKMVVEKWRRQKMC